MTPLLFLDVDGVLNRHEWDPAVMCGQIHRDKVARLNRVLRETGAKVVLSSAWRYIVHRGEANLMGMEWLLRSHGMLADRLAGITQPDTMKRPKWHGSQPWPVTDERGQQVADWIRDHRRADFAAPYVVLDDLDLGITACGHPFVQTVGTVGLTEDDADRAIQLLGSARLT